MALIQMPDVTNKKRIQVPVDDANHPVQLTPSTIALARTVSGTISAAQTITLNTATTYLRVYSADKDTYLKWGATTVTSSNFDEIIPANQIVDLYVPVGTPSLNVIERAATATVVIIEK